MAGDGTFGQLGLGPGVTSAGSPEQVKGMLTSYKVVLAFCWKVNACFQTYVRMEAKQSL